MAEFVQMNNRQILDWVSKLKAFTRHGYPNAVKRTVNAAATKTRDLGKQTVASKMTLRNRWVAGSIRAQWTKSNQVNSMRAIAGSVGPELQKQEFGATVRGSGKTKAIVTAAGAREPQSARPRKGLLRPRLGKLNLRKPSRKGLRHMSKRQRALVTIKTLGSQSRNDIFYLNLGRRQGFFRMEGPKLRMVVDLSRRSVKVKRNPWLGPATKTVTKHLPGIYRRELRDQMRRARFPARIR